MSFARRLSESCQLAPHPAADIDPHDRHPRRIIAPERVAGNSFAGAGVEPGQHFLWSVVEKARIQKK